MAFAKFLPKTFRAYCTSRDFTTSESYTLMISTKPYHYYKYTIVQSRRTYLFFLFRAEPVEIARNLRNKRFGTSGDLRRVAGHVLGDETSSVFWFPGLIS